MLARSLGVAIALVAAVAGDAKAAPCHSVALGGRATCTIEHGGRTREYRIYIPAGVTAPAPVVLNLHGRKGTAKEQEERLAPDAERLGFIVVSPQGYERSWNAGVGFGPAHDDGVDDLGFLRAVIAELPAASAVAIDPRRIYATGLSNGARMTHRLGCEASDLIAAIATVAGPIADHNTATGEVAFECKPPRAVPVMMIHGKLDRCTPYAGGDGIDTKGNIATPVAAQGWAERDRCTTVESRALGSTTCEVHRGCADGAEVVLCSIEQGGHVWPGSKKFPLWRACGGRWPDDFHATEEMWSFFAAHPMPGGEPAGMWQPMPVQAGADDEPRLHFDPIESVDLPFDHSQLSLTLRGTSPGSFDTGGSYRDGSLAAAGAVSLYSRLHVRGRELSGVRLMAQFRVEGETVKADMLGADQQVTKAALGLSAVYLAPSLNLYALYAGAAIAESRDTLSDPQLMPTVIGLGTYRSHKGLTWIYGGGFGYALGKPWLLPAAGVMWSFAPSWSLTAILPVVVDVRHAFSRSLAAHVVMSVSGDRYNFANDGSLPGAADTLQLRLGQGKLGLGVAYRWNKHWAWKGELGVVGPRQLTIADGAAMVMQTDGKGAGYLSTTVTYGFGNAPL